MIGPILLLLFAAPSSLDVQLAKWKPAKMPLDAAALSSSERQLVDKLVEASQYLELIYWEQADPEALRLY
ncbi:MAG: hypothetical protein ACRD9L_24175, partial [Bryobacteraceae bacterium]